MWLQARTLHITLNSVNVLLFAWQLPTGFTILQKARSPPRVTQRVQLADH